MGVKFSAIASGGAAVIATDAFLAVRSGTTDVLVTLGALAVLTDAPAGSLTGATLAAGVTASSLTSLGTLTVLNVAGVATITSTSASALTAGANGATNPVLKVNANTASVATGWEMIGAAAGAGAQLNVISSGTDEVGTINSKGNSSLVLNASNATAQVLIRTGGVSRILANSSAINYTNTTAHTFGTTTSSTAATVRYSVTNAGDTNLTAGAEAPFAYFNLGTTRQHAVGAQTLQRDFRITGTDHSYASASTLTDHAIFTVDASTSASTNATITNTSLIYIPSVTLTGTKTNSYALNIAAQAGATNNFAFRFAGSAGELINLSTAGKFSLLATNTAAGTTGAQTIDKPTGTVNFAAAATALVVTNALCTTSSIIHGVLRTNDTTARIANIVPGAGSFTINLTAAATAETSCGFWIIN